MVDIKQKFGTSNQTITITLNSLTNTSLRQSTAIDNTTNLFLNALVELKIIPNSAGTSATGYVNVYAYAAADGTTTYSGNATGTDGAYTVEKSNLRFIGSMAVNANSGTVASFSALFDVATAFGGVLPASWGIVVENLSGATLAASGHAAFYQGVYAQAA